jgi:hypothetical protein
MNAPLRDQRFVSTQDGSTWERKGYDREGAHGLYALAGSVEDSPRLWSVRELAELGLRGMTDVLPVPVGRELTEVERLRARLAEVEGQRAALAERLLAGQTWRQGRLAGEDLVAQSELRTIFAIPLAAPLGDAVEADGITRRIAPTQTLREESPLKGRARLDELTVERAEATHWKRLGLEDPHESPLHRTDRIPHDLPPLDGGQ